MIPMRGAGRDYQLADTENIKRADRLIEAATPYSYIARAYGKLFLPGDLVRHTVTNEQGQVKLPKGSHLHYVRVHFETQGFRMCHPDELELVNTPPHADT